MDLAEINSCFLISVSLFLFHYSHLLFTVSYFIISGSKYFHLFSVLGSLSVYYFLFPRSASLLMYWFLFSIFSRYSVYCFLVCYFFTVSRFLISGSLFGLLFAGSCFLVSGPLLVHSKPNINQGLGNRTLNHNKLKER